MRRSLARFSGSDALSRIPWLADFITSTSESRFSVHTSGHTTPSRPANEFQANVSAPSGVAFGGGEFVAWRRKALEVAVMIPDLSDKAIAAALFRLLDEIEAKAMATDRHAPISANNTGRVLALRLGLPTPLGKHVAKAANWRNGYYQHKRP